MLPQPEGFHEIQSAEPHRPIQQRSWAVKRRTDVLIRPPRFGAGEGVRVPSFPNEVSSQPRVLFKSLKLPELNTQRQSPEWGVGRFFCALP